MVAIVPDQQGAISPKAGVDAVERGSPGHLQPAINAQFTAGWGKDSVNLRPCHQRAGPDGASNAGLLWHGRHGRAASQGSALRSRLTCRMRRLGRMRPTA